MKFKTRTLSSIADMVCGNAENPEDCFFRYRSSSALTEFFEDCETDFRHDGSTRKRWVAEVLEQILTEPHPNGQTPPLTFQRVVEQLMDTADAYNEDGERRSALGKLNNALSREGFEAFYSNDEKCVLRHVATNTLASTTMSPHRPFSADEMRNRELLSVFLDTASEDEMTEEVLLPLFRQLGFHRITAAGHKDKALEYGKDVWMRFTLPTQHVLYFGIQAKKGKLDAAGLSKAGNTNIATIYNQVTMMLGHEIFDSEIGRRVLVDHAFIVAGGEITKAARNWIGNKLDAHRRSQILFMDREDIVNLFIVTSVPLPQGAARITTDTDFDLNF